MVRSRLLSGLVNWLRRHAAEDRHSVTVTVAPAQAERTFQIDLPRWSLRLLGVILVASFVLVLVGGILYGKLLRDAIVLREVRQENQILRARASRLEELEKDVATLDGVRRQLYALAGVEDAAAGSRTAADIEGSTGEGTGISGAPDFSGSSVSDGAPSVDAASAPAPGDAGADLTHAPTGAIPFRGPVSRGFSIGSERVPEHAGVDIAGREGSAVVAAGAGVVTFAGQNETFGNMVIIRHHGGWETMYGHNQMLLVAAGDSVQAGQRIAHLGSTGKSSAPHLHFEVYRDGKAVDPGACFPAYRAGP